MNRCGRPWKIPKDELIPKLVELRGDLKLSHKEIGRQLGYSWDRIRRLCYLFGIRKGLKPKRDVAADQYSALQRAGSVRPEET